MVQVIVNKMPGTGYNITYDHHVLDSLMNIIPNFPYYLTSLLKTERTYRCIFPAAA